MKRLTLILSLFFIHITDTFSQAESPENEIIVNISNFKSNKGQALIGLYNKKENFLKTRFKSFQVKIENNSCTVVFSDIPNGTYAVSMFHDENENGKIDTNFLGVPKEDYGCSNNAKGVMGPPKWEDAKFEIDNETITQNISL